MFDPYSHFLGLEDDRRPVTLYQLLGTAPDEWDRAVIEEAALCRASQVRRHQLTHPEESARMLNEIAQALLVLTETRTRDAYDAGLGDRQPGAPLAEVRRPAPMPAALQLALRSAGASEEGCTVWQVRMSQVALTAEQRRALQEKFRKGGPGGRRGRVLSRRKTGPANSEWVLAVLEGPASCATGDG